MAGCASLILSGDCLTNTSTQNVSHIIWPAGGKHGRVRIICGFFRDGCDQTNINYSYADSRLGSHSLFTTYHQLPCESYWKVNEELRDMKAAQTSCHSSATSRICVSVCVCVRLCVCARIPSGGCNRRGCACHFLIIDNEAHWDCGERWRGNGKLMQSDIITIQVMMVL